MAFASADEKTQRNLAGMMGKDTEYRQAENFQGSRFGVMLGNKSVVTNEVYREVVTPGDVRELDPDHEYILVTGYPKFKVQKLRYDQEPVFQERLLPAAPVGDGEGTYPDLPGEVEIEWLGMTAYCPPMPVKPDPKKPPQDAVEPASKTARGKKAKAQSAELPEWEEVSVPDAAPEPDTPKPVRKKSTMAPKPSSVTPPSVISFADESEPASSSQPKRRRRTLTIKGEK